ncbi:NAD(P)-dependent oxidoreductase [Aurantiacibacter xanthus]|uniref:NAD(P)-dependent oxidoreductase n=1 Tax=Aurantiacibacter xanthus TaxID=1784712 RepID=A0A3A1P1X0_9SPHN|nr:NAD(P)-dependent oxidoreductase [Aurantiacibacter xanthus]RIV81119.1 NAD(P)-dependent oxidoreductase [Aurantiacibacter xanthus]
MSTQDSNTNAPRVALIGFGEAGSTFARAGGWSGHAAGWDLLPERRAAMAECQVTACADAAEALAGAQLVLSLVTADQALKAAQGYAPMLPKDALFCDMNSVAPGTKQAAAAAVEAAGASYVDVAVMAPVDKALAVPLLIAGKRATEAEQMLRALGFSNTRVVGPEIGQASAIKLCRSVMVKGLEALTAEMVLAANKAGVLGEVLASLDASEKPVAWATRADYNLDRMLIHGQRRSAEMAEAARMLRDLGIDPLMTDNTVSRQQALGELGISPPPDGLAAKLTAINDRSTSGTEESEA